MTILYMFACLLGALTTLTILSSFGWAIALACAPLGGSALTLSVAGLVAWTERAAPQPTALTA